MTSMTGYAYLEYADSEYSLSVELKAYNNRYLDIGVYLPGDLSSLEPKIRKRCAGKIGRGKLECVIRYRAFDTQRILSVDEGFVRSLSEKLNRLREVANIEDSPQLGDLLRFEEVLREDRDIDAAEVLDRITPVLEETLGELDAARIAEGEATDRIVRTHLETVKTLVAAISGHSESLETSITENIRKRFREVLGDEVGEERILAETAVLLIKFSIDEEISRLTGHLEVFEKTLKESGQIGKKLDFLCQELHREINTIGSKSPLYEINRRIVEAKDAIEKIREQLRNVE